MPGPAKVQRIWRMNAVPALTTTAASKRGDRGKVFVAVQYGVLLAAQKIFKQIDDHKKLT
jgi:hypothetical protein